MSKSCFRYSLLRGGWVFDSIICIGARAPKLHVKMVSSPHRDLKGLHRESMVKKIKMSRCKRHTSACWVPVQSSAVLTANVQFLMFLLSLLPSTPCSGKGKEAKYTDFRHGWVGRKAVRGGGLCLSGKVRLLPCKDGAVSTSVISRFHWLLLPQKLVKGPRVGRGLASPHHPCTSAVIMADPRT